MKHRAIDVILLVLLSLLLIGISVAMLCIAIGAVDKAVVYTVVDFAYAGFWAALVVGVIGVVLLAFTFRVMIAFLRGPREAQARNAVVNTSEYGATYITLSAIDAIVQRHCKANPSIRECNSAVALVEGGVNLSLKLVVQNETVVPEITEQLKQSLKETVESQSGVCVRNIKILVAAPAAPVVPKPV